MEVEYDPSRVSYEELLEVFWENHEPTSLNRQGPDAGTQYRSAIVFHTPEQEAAARLEGESTGQVHEAYRHRDKACLGVLPGRRVPPAVLREEQTDPFLLAVVRSYSLNAILLPIGVSRIFFNI